MLRIVYLNGIPRSLLRGFQVLAKSVPEGAKFRNTPSACGGDRNFEDFASLFDMCSVYSLHDGGMAIKIHSKYGKLFSRALIVYP